MHLDQLRLRAAVAVAVGESPCDRVVALAEGAIVSCTLTNCVWLLLLPWLSVKVHVIVWSPWPKGPVTSATPLIEPSQASVAVGAAGRVAEHWAITSGS